MKKEYRRIERRDGSEITLRYFVRRWFSKCHHRVPDLDPDEWGTSYDGRADVYCSRHSYPKWVGKVPIDDLSFSRDIINVLSEER